MKYRQLTKEQFENLHEEFARFLASQSIDKKEWEQIKKEKPHVAEDEMNVFSDVVWDDVLTKTNYIEHISEKMINLFMCDKHKINRIVVKTNKENINLLNDDGFNWLVNNIDHSSVEILIGEKEYKDRNLEIFNLIELGGIISDNQLYNFINSLLKK